jgi:hypothetical protein
MKRRTALAALAVLIGLAGTAGADETTFCNQFIGSLPFTISTQGHYCFSQNLSTAITSGNAITINTDFVVLDLNNFKLGGGSAGLGTTAVGVFSNNHRNITVRNGNIRGFKYGIRLTGTSSGNLLVENNVLDGNTYRGVEVNGDSSVLRNNNVANTGGSTNTGLAWTYGLYANYSGSGASLVRDNVVTNTFNTLGYGTYGIGATNADHNFVVMGTAASGTNKGIWANICRDNTVMNAATAAYSCSNTVGSQFP